MTMTDTPPAIGTTQSADQPGPAVGRTTDPTAFERLVGSGDHRSIGRVFIVCSLVFLAAGAVLSALVDANTASDGSRFGAELSQRLLMNQQIGILLLGEPRDLPRIVCLVLIVGGILGLKATSGS